MQHPTHRTAALLVLAGALAGLWIHSSRARSAVDADATVRTASFRFGTEAVTRTPAPAPPFDLTASDGTGLRLVALEANGVLEGPLAFTELRLTFRNPRPETIEGRFRITLPPGAVLSRFAMKIGDRWQEGEVVERQRARQIYEDFLHRRQDPALLEQEAGNEFTARVFPIPGDGVKELIVSYSHALARSAEPYVIPLLGLPEVQRLDLRVLLGNRPAGPAPTSNLGGTASDRRVVELHKSAWTPTQDFEVPQDARADVLRDENLVVARLVPAVDAAPQEVDGLFVLVDSSASRALGWSAQVDLVEALVKGLRAGAGDATPAAVAAFDQTVTPIYEGTAAGFDAAHVRRLREHGALGASNLQGALAWLAARPRGARLSRVLVVTDGVATAGETEGGPLGAAVSALAGAGVTRLDVLAVGGLRDEAALARLVTGHLEHDGVVIDGAEPLPEIARRLTSTTRSGLEVAVAGAKWVWPQTLDGVQPGDEVLVYADLPADRPLRVALAGRPVALGQERAVGARPLLERAWVKSRIDRLLELRDTAFADDPDVRRAMASEVTRLSVEHRVLSPYTAFLVLETEWDYQRYGLDRRALADILTVGAGGLEVANRTPPPPPPGPQTLKPQPRMEQRRLEQARRVPVPDPAPDEPEPFVDARPRPDAEMAEVDDVVFGIPEVGAPEAEETELLRRVEAAPVAEPEGPIMVAPESEPPPARMQEIPQPRRRPQPPPPAPDENQRVAKPESPAPLTGRFAEIRRYLDAGRASAARELAESWVAAEPGDVLALVGLGEACEATGDPERAARAYGSLIDLFPARADLRRYAGERLERLETGLALALDTYGKALGQRPDHPSSHRLLAWALVRAGRYEEAFAALERGLRQPYPGRFPGVASILEDDLGLVAAAWERAEPQRRGEIVDRLAALGGHPEDAPSLRFVLSWETDANDVDLHVYDGRGGHAYFSNKGLPSGGNLYADVTTGYGPECFTVRGDAKKRAYPYRLEVNYYRRGPMGYGLGTVQVVEHDGRGALTVESRPFVVMADGAYVDLGSVK